MKGETDIKKNLCEWLVDIYSKLIHEHSKLIHEFPAVSSLAKARHFAIISLIRIKQVVIPTNNMVSQDYDIQEMFNNKKENHVTQHTLAHHRHKHFSWLLEQYDFHHAQHS